MQKRGQISTEYLIVVSFVLFVVLSALGVALFYSSQIKDILKFHQLDSFANKVTSLAESVFYAGAPSRTTTTGYLPEGVTNIQIEDNFIVFTIETSSGTSITSYRSNVNLTGSIGTNAGVHKIYLNATDTHVVISG